MPDQKQILEAIADSLALPVADIDPDAALQEDLGLNPVEVADLLNDLATKFNIVFTPAETQTIKTINNIIELVEDKMLE